MAHYHEVYFNPNTSDGPRVGMTRRTKIEIELLLKKSSSYRHPFGIVRCNRPDSQCPWTKDRVV